jgi:hypothetical protein
MSFAACLCLAAILGTPLRAEQSEFRCEWQDSETPYPATIKVNTEQRTASRDDESSAWVLLGANDKAIWIAAENSLPNSMLIAIQTVERSSVGGKWTETVLTADGAASAVSGGYCVELEK